MCGSSTGMARIRDRPAADRAVPVRGFDAQAVLRRHALEDRLRGGRGGRRTCGRRHARGTRESRLLHLDADAVRRCQASRSAPSPSASSTSRPRVASTVPAPAAPPMAAPFAAPLAAANDAADDRADAGAPADLRRILALGGLTLERQCVRAERIALTVHLHLSEANDQARTSSARGRRARLRSRRHAASRRRARP